MGRDMRICLFLLRLRISIRLLNFLLLVRLIFEADFFVINQLVNVKE